MLECIYANSEVGEHRQAWGPLLATLGHGICSNGPSPPPSSAGETTIGPQRAHGGSREALAAPPPPQDPWEGSVCWGVMMSSTGVDVPPGKDGGHRCRSVESTRKEPGLRWSTQIIAPL